MIVVHRRSGTLDGWYSSLQRYWWPVTCEFVDIAWQRRDKWPHERVLRGHNRDIQRTSVLHNPGFRLRFIFCGRSLRAMRAWMSKGRENARQNVLRTTRPHKMMKG